MRRCLLPLLCASLLGACTTLASLVTAVPPGLAVSEPRLMGTWEFMTDTTVEGRAIIREEGPGTYLIRWLPAHDDSMALVGRVGSLGPRRRVLEISAVADTTRYTHSFTSRDSTRLGPPSHPFEIPVHMLLVLELTDTGLVIAVPSTDSLQASTRSGHLKTQAVELTEELGSTVLMTEPDPSRLNAALRRFAERPGALEYLPRIGHRIIIPSWK